MDDPAPAAPTSGLRASRARLAVGLVVALVSDALSVWVELVPPLQIALDLATALALFAVLGFRWALLVPLVVEALPGLALFPTWILAVGALAAGARRRDPGA